MSSSVPVMAAGSRLAKAAMIRMTLPRICSFEGRVEFAKLVTTCFLREFRGTRDENSRVAAIYRPTGFRPRGHRRHTPPLPERPGHDAQGRVGETCVYEIRCRPNGSDVKLQAAHTRERTSGTPLAAMHTVLTLSVCKRRDAVRLALNQPARPAGAAVGGLSASAAS